MRPGRSLAVVKLLPMNRTRVGSTPGVCAEPHNATAVNSARHARTTQLLTNIASVVGRGPEMPALRRSLYTRWFVLFAAAAPRRSAGRPAFVDDAVLHHDLDVRERGNVEEWIPVDDDDVGELACLDRAELARSEE